VEPSIQSWFAVFSVHTDKLGARVKHELRDEIKAFVSAPRY
jgi:hypothetical protein